MSLGLETATELELHVAQRSVEERRVECAQKSRLPRRSAEAACVAVRQIYPAKRLGQGITLDMPERCRRSRRHLLGTPIRKQIWRDVLLALPNHGCQAAAALQVAQSLVQALLAQTDPGRRQGLYGQGLLLRPRPSVAPGGRLVAACTAATAGKLAEQLKLAKQTLQKKQIINRMDHSCVHYWFSDLAALLTSTERRKHGFLMR